MYKNRNNSDMHRNDVITAIAGFILGSGKGHQVDLRNPDYTICVEIIKVQSSRLSIGVNSKLQMLKHLVQMWGKEEGGGGGMGEGGGGGRRKGGGGGILYGEYYKKYFLNFEEIFNYVG